MCAISLPSVLMFAADGCASVPSHPYDAEAQRYKNASRYHAFGAPLVWNGVGALLLDAAYFVINKAEEPERGPSVNPAPYIITGLESLAVLGIGIALVSAGGHNFTPESWSPPASYPVRALSPAESPPVQAEPARTATVSRPRRPPRPVYLPEGQR